MPDLTLSPEQPDLDTEARVTDTDLRIAPRFWANHGTKMLRRLLNAIRDEA